MATKRRSPSQTAYTGLIKEKSNLCKGKATKTAVKAKATKYVAAAVKAGKSKTEATKTANRILTKGCSTSSYVAGKKKAVKRGRKPKTV